MSSPGQAHQILLIEDDPQETELYGELIRELTHCKIDVMSRVENSMDWISRSNYHLVVMDEATSESSGASLGRLGGLALLEQIKRMSPDTSVVVLSEYATVEQAVAAIRLGAEDYLKKPFNLDAFKLAVKRGLDRKVIFGESAGAGNFLLLLNSCQMISAALEQERIFGIIRSYLSRELKSDHSAIYSVCDRKAVRLSEAGQEVHPDRALGEILDIAVQASDVLVRMQDSGDYFRFVDRGQLTPGLFIFRFSCAGKEDYFCVCLSPERPVALDFFESRLRLLKAQIEVTGKNIEQYQGVQQLVYVDDATGLYNTRYLHYILEREIAQAQAASKSFAVLFIDADKFKQVNDTYGHLIGTQLLHELGNHLKKFVREKDTVFRYGGDEFVAVLSNCDLSTAKTVAERIRVSVEQECLLAKIGLDVRFTVTIGVAIFPDHARSKQEIVDAADRAMYGAKNRTRNSVMVAESETQA